MKSVPSKNIEVARVLRCHTKRVGWRYGVGLFFLLNYSAVSAIDHAPFDDGTTVSVTAVGGAPWFSGPNMPFGFLWAPSDPTDITNYSATILRVYKGGEATFGSVAVRGALRLNQTQALTPNRVYMFGFEVGRALINTQDESGDPVSKLKINGLPTDRSEVVLDVEGAYKNEVDMTMVGVSVGTGKTGVGAILEVGNELHITVNGLNDQRKNAAGQYSAQAYGIHVYGQGAKALLDTVTIDITGNGNGILLGEVQDPQDPDSPRGPGEMRIKNSLHISSGAQFGSAIAVRHQGSILDVDDNTSWTHILADGSAIEINQPAYRGAFDPVYDDPQWNAQTTLSFNNANMLSSVQTATLIDIKDGQKNNHISIRGERSHINAPSDGWLIDVGNNSDLEVGFKEGAQLYGIVNKGDTNSVLNIRLADAGTRWSLQEKGALPEGRIGRFSTLHINDGAVLDASSTGYALNGTAYLLQGDVASSNRGIITLSTAALKLLPDGSPEMDDGAYVVDTVGRAGDVLNVDGTYTANGGILVLDTELGGDQSVTDKFVFRDTAGNGLVRVHNVGGVGDYTQKGIKIIEVTDNSDAVFTQDGRVVSGSHEYRLERYAGEKDWYLTNHVPGGTSVPGATVQRPESGAYLANYLAANTMFNMQLHDRLGDAHYVNGAALHDGKARAGWGRIIGGKGNFKDATGQVDTDTERIVMQVGADVAQWGRQTSSRTHLGIMGGYGTNDANSRATMSGYTAKARIDGYHLGLYGTWFAKGAMGDGAYLDSWVTYNHFNGRVTGQDIPSERYTLSGWNASIEAGYAYRLGAADGNGIFVQPKGQVIVMGVDAPDYQEANGTTVAHAGGSLVQSRIGMRVYRQNTAPDRDGVKQFFIEGNWIHHDRDMAVRMNQSINRIAGMRNVGEVKLGIEARSSRDTHWWLGGGYRFGKDGFNDAQLIFGLKKLF